MGAHGSRGNMSSADVDTAQRRHQMDEDSSGQQPADAPPESAPGDLEVDCDDVGPQGGYGGTGPDQAHPQRKVGKA